MVTKLLSRAEMLFNPRALQAIRAEADGLVKAGIWDLSSVREKEDIRKEAKASGISVHFGQLMTIASIEFYELADHLLPRRLREGRTWDGCRLPRTRRQPDVSPGS